MEERHTRIRRVRIWQTVPPVRVEQVCRFAPELGEVVNGDGEHLHRRSCEDGVSAELIVGAVRSRR